MTTTIRRPWCRHALLAAWLLAGGALGAARLSAEQPAATPAPAGAAELKITLKWTTASEVDNYGYFVQRSDTPDGPWTQMNKKAIPGAGNSDTPSHYVWEDHDVQLGRTYYYWLESISVQGAREKFSPVLSRKCCGTTTPQATPTPAAPSPEPSPTPAGS